MIIDMVAEWVRQFLTFLPEQARAVLWLPALVAVIALGSVLVVQKLLPALAGVAAALARWGVMLAGALALLPEAAAAYGFRTAGMRPAPLLYVYGDAVASLVIRLSEGAHLVGAGMARLAKANTLVVLLLAGGWLWLWNDGHCPDDATPGSCTRPVTMWVEGLSSD